MTNTTINLEISSTLSDTTNHVVNFKNGTYYGASYTVQDNVVLDGNRSTFSW